LILEGGKEQNKQLKVTKELDLIEGLYAHSTNNIFARGYGYSITFHEISFCLLLLHYVLLHDILFH